MKRVIVSEGDLKDFAHEMNAQLQPGTTLALVGELGAGKTTFVRYLAQSLGATTPVSSPTYVLCHEYQSTSLTLEHWDLYRLVEAPEELSDQPNPTTLRLIEWADRFPDVLEQCDVVLTFTLNNDGTRQAHFEK